MPPPAVPLAIYLHPRFVRAPPEFVPPMSRQGSFLPSPTLKIGRQGAAGHSDYLSQTEIGADKSPAQITVGADCGHSLAGGCLENGDWGITPPKPRSQSQQEHTTTDIAVLRAD